MRTSIALCLVAALASTSMLSVGCTDTSSDSGESGDVSEVNEALLTNVGGFELDDKRTIAAPAKVKKLLRAIKKERQGALRCIPAERVTIWGQNGGKMGTLGMMCNPEEAESGKVQAQLDVELGDGLAELDVASKPTSYIVEVDTKIWNDVRQSPTAVGDIVFGATSVQLGQGIAKPLVTDAASDFAELTKGLGADQVPDAASRPRCLPDYVVTFYKGKSKIAIATACGSAGTIEAAGAKEASGLTKVDSAGLGKVYARLAGSAK